MFSVKHANHLVFFNNEYSRMCNRGRCPHSNRLTCHAPLTKKVTWSQNRHDCFFADLINNGELYTTLLNVHHTGSGITLRVGFLGSAILDNFSRNTDRSEIRLGIENMLFIGFRLAGPRDYFHNAPA